MKRDINHHHNHHQGQTPDEISDPLLREQSHRSHGQTNYPATPHQMAVYNETMSQQEGKVQSLIRQITTSPYAPTREQMIKIATVVLTMLLMMLLGPAAGTQAGLVEAAVRQVMPLIVTAAVHFAADRASPMDQLPPTDSITNADISPVLASQSAASQAI